MFTVKILSKLIWHNDFNRHASLIVLIFLIGSVDNNNNNNNNNKNNNNNNNNNNNKSAFIQCFTIMLH